MVNCKTAACSETASDSSLSRVSMNCPPLRPELPPEQNFRVQVNNYEVSPGVLNPKPQQPSATSNYAQSDTSEELNVDGNDEDNSNDSAHGLSLVGIE